MTLSPAQRQTLTWVAIAAAALLLLWLLAPVLTPFVVGAVLAYALHPAVERLAARRVPRLLSVLLVEVVFIVAVLAVLLLIVPIISKELPMLREQIPTLADRLNRNLSPWLAQFGIHVQLDIAGIKAFVLKYLDANLEDWLGTVLSSARIGGSILLAVIGNAVLVPVVLFYLLMDWPRLVERSQALIPRARLESVTGFLDECDVMLGQYLRGQLLVMLILAAFYAIGLALFRFDLALPVGVFTGLAIFIPYLGFGLGLLLALLAGLLQFASWYGVVAVAVVYGIGQVVESLFLTPRLVGERIGMNPLMVIFALLAFGHLFGFVGVLIALPVSAVLVVAVRRLRTLYLDSPLYRG
ncbi:MAG: AI-2E family transporter [Piscinibacter sp.]|uniref:AI-2E family transporter n=1 Tax=Piscinibacter sp. TaxID=1903157 RepID=UPI00258702E5|nr:AI-2E family transporter [Piscinibacter sp.]MCW5664547.1 AI-2E family transporter [Piscinibacter sp.]